MTPEQQRWAEALKIEQLFGTDAPAWITQRIAVSALAGDEAGVARFREIATCFEQLLMARRDPAA